MSKRESHKSLRWAHAVTGEGTGMMELARLPVHVTLIYSMLRLVRELYIIRRPCGW